jgi:hypothetical protein
MGEATSKTNLKHRNNIQYAKGHFETTEAKTF